MAEKKEFKSAGSAGPSKSVARLQLLPLSVFRHLLQWCHLPSLLDLRGASKKLRDNVNTSWRLREELDFSALYQASVSDAKNTRLIPSRAHLTRLQNELLSRCAGVPVVDNVTKRESKAERKAKQKTKPRGRLRVLRFSQLTVLPVGVLHSIAPALSSLQVFEVLPMAGLYSDDSMMADFEDECACVDVADKFVAWLVQTCPKLEVLTFRACHGDFGLAVAQLAARCAQFRQLRRPGNRWAKMIDLQTLAPKARNLEVVSGHTSLLRPDILALAECTRLTGLDCTVESFAEGDEFVKLAKSCPDLTQLNANDTEGHLDALLTALAENCPSLTHLEIEDAALNDPQCFTSLGRLTKLQHLNVRSVDSCIPFLAECTKSWKELRDINLYNIDISDESLQALHCCPGLRKIDLRFNKKVTVVGLAALAEHCQHIETLLLHGTKRPDEKALPVVNKLFSALPNITRLETWSKPKNDEIQLLAHRCPRLTSLNLGLNCSTLTSKALEVVAKHCALSELSFAYLRTSPEKLLQLLRLCPRLQYLSLSCESTRWDVVNDEFLAKLPSCCPMLMALDLHGHHGYTKAGVDSLARGCPLLHIVYVSTREHRGQQRLNEGEINALNKKHPFLNVQRS